MKRGRVKGETDRERGVPCVGEEKGKFTRDENRTVSRGPPTHARSHTPACISRLSFERAVSKMKERRQK